MSYFSELDYMRKAEPEDEVLAAEHWRGFERRSSAKPTCETCNDTKEILVTVGNGVVIDDQLQFLRAPRPCPDCTEEGRAWEAEEQRQILAEYRAYLAASPAEAADPQS